MRQMLFINAYLKRLAVEAVGGVEAGAEAVAVADKITL